MNNLLKMFIFATFFIVLIATTASAEMTVLKTGKDQPAAATLTFSAAPLKTMTEIPFVFEFDNKEARIKSAACSLTMPAMPMPGNHPEMTCIDYKCTGKAIFTMAGSWQSTFGMLMNDGSHKSIVFDIKMVEMK